VLNKNKKIIQNYVRLLEIKMGFVVVLG